MLGFKLTAVERVLLVESVPFTYPALEEKIKLVCPGATEVNLTLAELRALASCLAAQIKRSERDRKLAVRLIRIWRRIKEVEQAFGHE